MTTTSKVRAPRLSEEDKTARLAEAHETIRSAVAAITGAEDWKRYLTFASRFHKYSFNNILLMAAQADARGMAPLTHVAGFRAWLNNHNRGVRKGERGLKIFAPIVVKKVEGDPGFPGTKVVGFRITTVFDVQQTDGEPLPVAPRPTGSIAGEAPAGALEALGALVTGAGFPWSYGATGAAEGFTTTGRIVISDRLESNPGQTFAVLVHEAAHALLHMEGDYDYAAHRGVAETEAESVAYVVATHFGIDMADTAFHYVAGWARDADVVVAAGARIMKTAAKIIDTIEAAIA